MSNSRCSSPYSPPLFSSEPALQAAWAVVIPPASEYPSRPSITLRRYALCARAYSSTIKRRRIIGPRAVSSWQPSASFSLFICQPSSPSHLHILPSSGFTSWLWSLWRRLYLPRVLCSSRRSPSEHDAYTRYVRLSCTACFSRAATRETPHTGRR